MPTVQQLLDTVPAYAKEHPVTMTQSEIDSFYSINMRNNSVRFPRNIPVYMKGSGKEVNRFVVVCNKIDCEKREKNCEKREKSNE